MSEPWGDGVQPSRSVAVSGRAVVLASWADESARGIDVIDHGRRLDRSLGTDALAIVNAGARG
jgi:hypothetical protein